MKPILNADFGIFIIIHVGMCHRIFWMTAITGKLAHVFEGLLVMLQGNKQRLSVLSCLVSMEEYRDRWIEQQKHVSC